MRLSGKDEERQDYFWRQLLKSDMTQPATKYSADKHGEAVESVADLFPVGIVRCVMPNTMDANTPNSTAALKWDEFKRHGFFPMAM